MTYEEFKQKLLIPNSGSEAFNSGVKQANSRAKRLFKNINNGTIVKYTKKEMIEFNISNSKDVNEEEYGRFLINTIYGSK